MHAEKEFLETSDSIRIQEAYLEKIKDGFKIYYLLYNQISSKAPEQKSSLLGCRSLEAFHASHLILEGDDPQS